MTHGPAIIVSRPSPKVAVLDAPLSPTVKVSLCKLLSFLLKWILENILGLVPDSLQLRRLPGLRLSVRRFLRLPGVARAATLRSAFIIPGQYPICIAIATAKDRRPAKRLTRVAHRNNFPIRACRHKSDNDDQQDEQAHREEQDAPRSR